MEILLYKYLSLISYTVSIGGAVLSGVLLYSGLMSRSERVQTKLRFNRSIKQTKDKIVYESLTSEFEERFRKAGYPLKLNAVRFSLFRYFFLLILLSNYVLVPVLSGQSYSIYSIIGILIFYVFTMPNQPFSITEYLLRKVIGYRVAKLNSEIFIFHDLLIGEITMMTNARINTYNIIRSLKPYFDNLNPLITKLLSSWNEDGGPEKALDNFAEELGSNEAKSLVSVLKTLDMNERETALKALQGMNDLFARSQIENYRRKRKFIADLGSMPIKIAIFLSILNFLILVMYMVSIYLDNSSI